MKQLWNICSAYRTLIFADDAAVMAGGRIVSSTTMLGNISLSLSAFPAGCCFFKSLEFISPGEMGLSF